MPITYDRIATTTLGSSTSTITFASIGSGYTDLRLVWTGRSTIDIVTMFMRFNSDTGTNYSGTTLYGDGSSAGSFRNTNLGYIALPVIGGVSTTVPTFVTTDIFSYAGSTFKSLLTTGSDDRNGSGYAAREVWLWRSTSAINTITLTLSSGNFATGTTATLYGILRA